MKFYIQSLLFTVLFTSRGSLAVSDNEKANIEDFFRNSIPENEIIEKCKDLANVKFTKSTDIICMLGVKDKEPSYDVKCLIECVTNLQNITENGILDPLSISRTLEQKNYSKKDPSYLNAFALNTFCSFQIMVPFGLHKKSVSFRDAPFDKCLAAYGSLQCLQLPGLTDSFIHLYNCSNYN